MAKVDSTGGLATVNLHGGIADGQACSGGLPTINPTVERDFRQGFTGFDNNQRPILFSLDYHLVRRPERDGAIRKSRGEFFGNVPDEPRQFVAAL